jgi:hypothetical protein
MGSEQGVIGQTADLGCGVRVASEKTQEISRKKSSSVTCRRLHLRVTAIYRRDTECHKEQVLAV